MGFFKKLLNNIFNASIPTYKFEDNKLFFKLNLEEYFEYELGEYDIKTRHDPFIYEAYTLNNKEIFLEYIKTDDVIWNGQPLSLYEGFFKKKLNINYLEVLENIEISNYILKTYKVDNSFIIHLIYIYSMDSETFIIDVKGNLYKKLLSLLDKEYIYKYTKELKSEINFNISMVKENSLRGFFNVSD